MAKKRSATSLISDLKRKTRKSYNSEEKIRIIIDSMCGESSIAELFYKIKLHFPLPFQFNRASGGGFKSV